MKQEQMKEALSVKQPCCVEDTLKMALEALENSGTDMDDAAQYQFEIKAITAIQEALMSMSLRDGLQDGAQPEQEPVAWMASDDPSAIESSPPHPELIHQWIPLYTHPPVPWTEKQIKEYAQQQRAQMPEAPL